jgi:hypothetical protein
MADPTFPVEPPTRTPRRGGIRSVAEFRQENRIGLGGTLVYVSPGCSLAVETAQLCYPSPATPQAEKTYDGIETLDAVVSAFGGYYGVECWLDGEDYATAAREGLERGEDRLIESALNLWFTALPSSGAPATFTEAIALAEENADDNYPGAPIIVMNRGDAVKAAAEDALDFDREGNLWTPNGTRVLSSGRITANSVGVLGALTIVHTDVTVTNAPVLVDNKEFAIAERVYSILVDCNLAARYVVTPAP